MVGNFGSLKLTSLLAAGSQNNDTTSGGAPGGVTINLQAIRSPFASSKADGGMLSIRSLFRKLMGVSTSNIIPPPPGSVVDLNVAVDNYRPVEVAGFSDQRPEIVAAFQFQPVFFDTSPEMGPVGEMIDLQISSRHLRAESITRLLNELRADPAASATISSLEQRLEDLEATTDAEIGFLQEMVQHLAAARRSLTIRSNLDFIRSDQASRFALTTDADPVVDVMVNSLGFTDAGLRSFSDTKILMQMLDDLLNIIRSPTPNLTGRIDPRRASDTDPYDILHLTDVTAGGSGVFDVRTLRSRSSSDLPSVLHRSTTEAFNALLGPVSSYDDRVKTLLSVISKELRISSGLSNQVVRDNITQTFGIADDQVDGRAFELIIGLPGNDALAPAAGADRSIAKLLRVDVGDVHVAPFESVFTDRPTDPLVPGSAFYVDSIVSGKNGLDATAFVNYGKAFGRSITALANVVEGTLDVNVVNSDVLGLSASTLLNQFLSYIRGYMKELSGPPLRPDVSFIESDASALSRDVFTPALLAAAADDAVLKYMIVLYVLHVGITAAYQPGAPKTIFTTLVESSDFNRGSNVSKDVDPTAGVRAAMARVLALANSNPVSQFGGRNQTDDFAIMLSKARGTVLSSNAEIIKSAQDLVLPGMDVISLAITGRVLDLFAQYQFANTGERISSDQIFSHLASVGDRDQNFLLKLIVDFITMVDRAARAAVPGNISSDSPDYFSSNTPGLTRFGKIGAHTLILMVVELFVSFFKAYPVCTFAGADEYTGTRFSVTQDRDMASMLQEALDQLLPQPGLAVSFSAPLFALDAAMQDRITKVRSTVDRFAAMRTQLDAEGDTIRKIVEVMMSVANGIQKEAQAIERFFDRSGPNGAVIAEILSSVGADTKLAALDEAQVALSQNAVIEYKAGRASAGAVAASSATGASTASPPSPFIDDTLVPESVRAALFSMLSSPGFRSPAGDDVSILAVGLPAGFMASLHKRASSFTVGLDFAELGRRRKIQNNVVRVHVHMRDLLFEDVVFKPKTFLLEVGRFVGPSDFNDVKPDDGRSFDVLVQQVISSRALSVDGAEYRTEVGPATANDASYSGVVDESERLGLATNHIVSYLLKVYLKLLTGIDLGEDRFYLDPSIADLRVDPEAQAMFVKLLTDRVSKFAGRKLTLDELRTSNPQVDDLLTRIDSTGALAGVIAPVDQALTDAQKAVNVEVSEDLLSFIRLFGPSSILFGAGARAERVTAPKLFERIFLLPVDPDAFEIDRDLTASTSSGASFMGSQLGQRLIAPVPGVAPPSADVSRLPMSTISPVRFEPSVRTELGDVSLRQFFVVVEQLPELPDLKRVTSPNFRGNVDKHEVYGPTGQGFSIGTANSNRVISGRTQQVAPSRTDAEENMYDAAPTEDKAVEGHNWASEV